MSDPPPAQLQRRVGLGGAILLGLGSMLGTGVFLALGLAAGVVGYAALPAVVVAGAVAWCSALSSAQLAAAHPVAGGTYEYGYRYLSPSLGFIAGWLFLCAKSASAATAALGLSGYLLHLFGASSEVLVPLALGLSVFVTLVVVGGVRRTNAINAVLVVMAFGALAWFVVAGAGRLEEAPSASSFLPSQVNPFLHATALVFVAFTGYGRVATLGEEIRDPQRNIPRAIGLTVGAVLLIYLAVAYTALSTAGPSFYAEQSRRSAAPLAAIARTWEQGALAQALAIGAAAAMGGVLLNLVLGLSRVVLAMGRRGDLPRRLALLDRTGTSPRAAVIAVGVLVSVLGLVGDVGLTWSFSAFCVLLYYGLTNAAALRMERSQRRYPRGVAWAGLVSCFFLALQLDVRTIGAGGGAILLGLLLFTLGRRRRSDRAETKSP